MKRTLNGLALASAALAAQAGTLTVTVTDKDGKPAPDVVVLVDMPPLSTWQYRSQIQFIASGNGVSPDRQVKVGDPAQVSTSSPNH